MKNLKKESLNKIKTSNPKVLKKKCTKRKEKQKFPKRKVTQNIYSKMTNLIVRKIWAN